MKVSMLGSGSRGNATVLRSGETTILVDVGFSGRQVERRLEAVGIDAGAIDAIVITHEHGDHTRGAGVFARRFGTPVYMTEGTLQVCAPLFRGGEEIREYHPGRTFRIGSLEVEPFLTAHDAVDPVAVAVECAATGLRVGVATDLGRPTAGIRHALRGCHLLILEANHDEGLLRSGPYPPSVQGRIASSHGHLSNTAAARFACELLHPGLVGILLAHLSGECNRPELARQVVESAVRREGFTGLIEVVPQDHPTELLDLESLRRERGPPQLTFL